MNLLTKDPKQTIGASLLAGSAGLAGIIQIPGMAWATVLSILNLNVWNISVFGQSRSYFDAFNDCTNDCPSNQILDQLGGPLLAVATILLAVAAIMAFTGKGRPAGTMGIIGSGVALVMIVLFTIGIMTMFDNIDTSSGSGSPFGDVSVSPTLSIGFYLAIVMLGAGIAGAILVLKARPAVAGGAMPYGTPAAAGAYGGAQAAPMGAAAAPAAPGVRRLKCPKCATVISVASGARPVCNACGFGA